MISLPCLDDGSDFPDISTALKEPNGLLAFGGDLSVSRLISAYKKGIFPWYNQGDEPILWWSPTPRCVLFPEDIRINRSLKKTINRQQFSFTIDHAFERVISLCGEPRQVKGVYETGTWINDDLMDAYIALHHEGFAHSIEVWESGELVGGLYGVAMDGMFFGESMFSRVSNASKYALVKLCHVLTEMKISIIDCQVVSEHLISLGAIEIDRELFQKYLDLPYQGSKRWCK
jgi:leucyl/phenylalanyl-tRNA---protein transferase